MNRIRTSLATVAFLMGTTLGTSSTNAASLSTDVSVNMGSVLMLACFDQVDVNPSSETFIAAVGQNSNRPLPSLTRNARANPGELIANGRRREWTRGRYRFRRRVNLELLDICAYRSLGGIGGARVAIDPLESRLEAVGGSHIDVMNVRTRDNQNAGEWRRRFNIPAADLGNDIVRGIDVRLRLDLQNATEPGTYSSPTDGTFLITVTPNP